MIIFRMNICEWLPLWGSSHLMMLHRRIQTLTERIIKQYFTPAAQRLASQGKMAHMKGAGVIANITMCNSDGSKI